MKVSREQVQQHRERILTAAARLFRERGFHGVSVAEIMQAAGLTHGGFYGHFGSKEALIAEVLDYQNAPRWYAAPAGEKGADYADAYLSKRHRDDQGRGCAIAGLGADVVRESPEARAALTRTIRRRIDRLTADSPGSTPARRRRAAVAAFSAMVGAVVLARVVDDDELSEEILADTRRSIDLH